MGGVGFLRLPDQDLLFNGVRRPVIVTHLHDRVGVRLWNRKLVGEVIAGPETTPGTVE